jgi:hypothetical protein
MLRRVLAGLGFYSLWAALAALLALAAYQVYATLLYVGLWVVRTPALRPAGWNSATIHGLGRFLVLVLGCVWLLAVSLLEHRLRQGEGLRSLVLRLVVGVGALYVVSYGALLLLSR